MAQLGTLREREVKDHIQLANAFAVGGVATASCASRARVEHKPEAVLIDVAEVGGRDGRKARVVGAIRSWS